MARLIEETIQESNLKQSDFIGPVPAYYARRHGLWRWQIVLRGPEVEKMLSSLPLKDWLIEIDPHSLL